MIRKTLMATGFLALCGGAALAQGFPPEPPHGYMAAPPPAWAHRDSWVHMHEADRQAYWAHYRHESWHCDHGDREACGWVHAHG